MKRHRRLDRKKTHNEAIRKSLCVITKLIFESSVRLRETGDGLLWKCRPRRSGRGSAIEAPRGAAAGGGGATE
jgi:hypothetical protein